ncbi:hypothetical protein C7271_03345 [filamentous cyanobacterium CCP5]|nr:hypothetical protein C7271_03345 [filamentous cyanobacterium CCP5]
MADDSQRLLLQQALQLYVEEFGQPQTVNKLEGIVGALMAVQQQVEQMVPTAKATQTLAHQVAQEFTSGGVRAALDDLQQTAQASLVQAAHQRWQGLENQARSVLSAYLQTKVTDWSEATSLPLDQLKDTVTTIIPIVADGDVNSAEAHGLIGHISQVFDLPEAIATVISPTHIELAKRVVLALGQRPLETIVESALSTYRDRYEPALETFGVGLIERMVQAATDGRMELDLDLDLDLASETRQVLLQQIAFRANILAASPPASKTAQEIAAEVHQEVQRFRAERAETLGTVNGTTGILSEDGLEISSPWEFTGSRRSDPSES